MLGRPGAMIGLLALAGCATVPPAAPVQPVEVQILAINDFHGNLEPPNTAIEATAAGGTTVKVPAGGAAYLAGAAIVIADGDLTAERLRDEVDGLLLDGAKLRAMSEASRALARPDAADMIARQVMGARK